MIICVGLMLPIKNESVKTLIHLINGVSIPRRGYPIGLWNANALTSDDEFDASGRDADNYTIRNWLGLLSGGASTNIIHTDMYGQIDIETFSRLSGTVRWLWNSRPGNAGLAASDPAPSRARRR